MTSLVVSSCRDGVARVRLNRADKRNALTRGMLEDMLAAVKFVGSDRQARVCLIEAEGPVFCAGMDLGEMQARALGDDSEAEWQRDSDIYCELLNQLFSLEIPTIAVVQGAAVAGGVGIVLACDMTIASEASFFALPEPVRGITAAMVTPLLVQRVGWGAARHLLLSMERCDAARALQIGLANDVVPTHQLAARVNELVTSVLSGSPLALSLTKQHLRSFTIKSMSEQLRDSAIVSAQARQTPDAREGLQAFLDKRRPTWQK